MMPVVGLFIPSPSQGVWHLGPFPVRGYALCIILGVIVAVAMGERRWVARGGLAGQVSDISVWAVPFGLVGGRLYHVITDPARYFGSNGDPVTALYVWQGGLGIWGAIALGGVGAWIGARRTGVRLPPLADALAPGIVVAQAIGRWGNWFNQELFGKPTTRPWALEIEPDQRPPGYEAFETFHPTFLYECIWDLGAAGVVIWVDRKLKLGHGRAFALYVMAYTAGRGWIEYLRIDTVEANDVFGLRLNVWTSIILFVLSTAYFVLVGRRHPGREESVWREGHGPAGDPDADDTDADDADDAAGSPDASGRSEDEATAGSTSTDPRVDGSGSG
jgi:prolipoprotein diacylglyceryl transferase